MNINNIFYANIFLNFFLILFIILQFNKKFFFIVGFFLIIFISFFFRRDMNLRYFILLNFFILFYFSYSEIIIFLKNTFSFEINYFLIFIYEFFLVFLFSSFLNFKISIKKIKFKVLKKIFFLSFLFSLIFILTYEKIPNFLYNYNSQIEILFVAIIFSFFVALVEQLIFINIFLNSYEKLNKRFSKINFNVVALLFTTFHILKIENLIIHYKEFFGDFFFLAIILYLIGLFFFFKFCIHIYKKYDNILYPILLHFIVDFILIFVFLTFT